MARPPKQGLDYFPFDTDFFQNKKIRILKKEYGADGITIYMYLLCEIYKNGYYVIADEDFICVMADELCMNVNKIRQVLKFLLGRSLFGNKLFQSDTILTSESVQRCYQFALQERINDHSVNIEDFWLLKKSDSETLGQVRHFSENPQEKSGMKTIKESKEKKKKLNDSISKCATPLGAREKEKLINEFGKETVEDYIERTKAYKCCNYDTIREWILEDKNRDNGRKPRNKNQFNNFMQREVTKEQMDDLEQKMLRKGMKDA